MSWTVPLVLLVSLSVVLSGTLTLLSPEYGVFAVAANASWGNATYTLPGLEHPVTVIRDDAGTTHIYAQDDPDLFYAQGYTQASDRLFQMEAESLVAQGNLSSWLGPSEITSDKTFRYLGVPEAAAAMVNSLQAHDPSEYADFTAYVAGVNAYISWAESHHDIPLEFQSLGVQPYTWSLYASFCFERFMVISQTTGLVEPLFAAIAADATSDAAVNLLFALYPQDWQNFTVLPGNGTVNGVSLGSLQHVNASYVFSQDWLGSWATGISSSEEQALAPLYRAAVDNLSDPYIQYAGPGSGVGSNSWVVAGNRTTEGYPLLANDPHLPLLIPSLWVATELVDPNYDVEGWALAGTPGILIGHNAHMAWALTNSEGATALEYVETLQGDQYLFDGTWHDFTWDNTTIDVAGGTPVPLDVPWTNNGPIVARIGDYGISPNWAGTGVTYEAGAELSYDQATTIPQFMSILEENFTIPNLNFLLASESGTPAQGSIGWVVPAHYPLVQETLPDGSPVTVIGSRAPLNGSGAFEPAGTIASDLSPQVVNPAQGYLFAPNQPTVGQDFPYPMIGGWWDSGGRAHSIGTFLATHPVMSVALMETLQANVTDAWAQALEPQLDEALTAVASGTSAVAGLAQAGLAATQGWNATFYTQEVAPTIYTYWYNELVQQNYEPVMAAAGLGGVEDPFPSAYQWLAVNDPTSYWFPDGFENASVQAMTSALEFLQAHDGAAVSDWTWGGAHPFTLPSLSGVAALSEGPWPENGDTYTVSVGPVNSSLVFPLHEVSIGSSLRMVTAPMPSPSFGIFTGGESGDPASAYYDNLQGLWLSHQYVAMSLVPSSDGPFPEGVVSTWQLQP